MNIRYCKYDNYFSLFVYICIWRKSFSYIFCSGYFVICHCSSQLSHFFFLMHVSFNKSQGNKTAITQKKTHTFQTDKEKNTQLKTKSDRLLGRLYVGNISSTLLSSSFLKLMVWIQFPNNVHSYSAKKTYLPDISYQNCLFFYMCSPNCLVFLTKLLITISSEV